MIFITKRSPSHRFHHQLDTSHLFCCVVHDYISSEFNTSFSAHLDMLCRFPLSSMLCIRVISSVCFFIFPGLNTPTIRMISILIPPRVLKKVCLTFNTHLYTNIKTSFFSLLHRCINDTILYHVTECIAKLQKKFITHSC